MSIHFPQISRANMKTLNDLHQPAYQTFDQLSHRDHEHCWGIVSSTVEIKKPYWPRRPFAEWPNEKQFEYAKNICTEYVIDGMTDDELKRIGHPYIWNGEKDSASLIKNYIYGVRWYITLEIDKRGFQLSEFHLLCDTSQLEYKDPRGSPMWIEVDEHFYGILQSQCGQKNITQVRCIACGIKKYCGFEKMSLFICNKCSCFIILWGSLEHRIKKMQCIKGAFELQLLKGDHFDYRGLYTLPYRGPDGGRDGGPDGGPHGGSHGASHGGSHGGSHGVLHGGSHGGPHGGPDLECDEKNNTPNKPLVKSKLPQKEKKEEEEQNISYWFIDTQGKRRPKIFLKWERAAECVRDIVAKETKYSHKTGETIAKLKFNEKEIKFMPIISGCNPYENKMPFIKP